MVECPVRSSLNSENGANNDFWTVIPKNCFIFAQYFSVKPTLGVLNQFCGVLPRSSERQIIGLIKGHRAGIKKSKICHERGIANAPF